MPAGAAILATALAYFFATGVNHLWPFAWVAPIPILLLSFASSARTTAISAFSAYLLGELSILPVVLPVLPPAVLLLALVVPAFVFALTVLFTRYTLCQFDHWVGMFVFPVLWTAWEYLVSVQGTYGSWAYSQVDFLPVIQLASVTGLAGITFLVSLVPAGLAVAWHFRDRRRHMIPALGIPLALWLSVVGWGWVRLAQPALGARVRVGLAATDETVRYFRTERSAEALAVVTAYAQRIGKLGARGAQVVVLPEKFVGVTPAYSQSVRDILADAARTHRVTVVAGLNQIEQSQQRNLAVVFSPNGEVQMEYHKVHLIPVYEANYRVGESLGVLSTAQGTWGVAICRDMDFPDLGRSYSRAGVGIMLIPAWDFVADGRIHARMAVMRGVEGGYAVVRSAQEGLVTVSDHHGRILAEGATSAEPEVLLLTDVTPGPGSTFYARTGDWFARLNAAGAAIILAMVGGHTVIRVARGRSQQRRVY